MTTKVILTIILGAIFLPFFAFSQTIEKITFDEKDADGYYVAVQPLSKNNKGAVVVLTSFLPPEGVLPETKLHNVASANDILTIVVSTKQKLYADSSVVSRLNAVLVDVMHRFSVAPSKVALAGYDEAGGIALRYTELAHEQPAQFPVQPRAVFGIDAPVDLFGLWHWAERQIQKNYWQGAVGDAKYYIDAMTKENGTIYNHAARYKYLSPFYRESQEAGYEQYLKNVAVRLYYDTDVDWQLRNRRNSLYDTKIPDGSELISRLLLAGSDKAEFIAAKQPGMRSNGMRTPNSFSIVDEVDCIQWMKRSLNIFDAHTWVPPYDLPVPTGWQVERFALPPDFASPFTYSGVEDIRFAPGWGDVKSEEHWAYSFLWWLDGTPGIDAATLQANLTAYYTGLVGRNLSNVPAEKRVATTVAVKKIKSLANDRETFSATINMLDYHEQKPMVLNGIIHVKDIATTGHTAVYIQLSPRPLSHIIWKKMDEIGDKFKVKN
jgi:hypothetical protein